MRLSRLFVSVVATTALIVLAPFGIMSSASAAADSHHITTPTAGVTCDEWKHIVAMSGDVSYLARCTGRPTGFSSGYRYREAMECDASGAYWTYSPWRNDGSWSGPLLCPGGSGVIAHKLQFQWV